jgi:molybdopterin converting factor small subunit
MEGFSLNILVIVAEVCGNVNICEGFMPDQQEPSHIGELLCLLDTHFCQVCDSGLYWAKCRKFGLMRLSLLLKTLDVHVQLYSILREKLPAEARGRTTLQIEGGATLADIVELLEIKRNIVIGVNGAYERDHSRPLQDGDELTIFSVVSGG